MPTSPHAVLANWRVAVEYTIQGHTHKTRAYMTEVVNNAGAWYAVKNGTSNTWLPWESCAHRLALVLQQGGLSSDTWGAMTLEYRNGTVWELLDVNVPTMGTVSNSSFTFAGVQLTITLRDASLNRFKIVSEERYENNNRTSKVITDAQVWNQTYINSLVTTGGDDYDPVNWMCSKYAIAVKPGGFVSWATYPNRKVLRSRGLK